QQQHHIGPADRTLGTVIAVELDVVGDHVPLFAHAGGVDHDECLAFFFDPHVDAVARGAGDFADNDAVALLAIHFGDRIHQRALAGVALADDGNHHLRIGHLG